jgi:hypothetical protein
VVRIFVKLKIKLKGRAKIEPLNLAIKMWKYDISVLDLKATATDNDSLNLENSITKEEPPLRPEIILLYRDLIECFDHLRAIVRSESSLGNDLVPLFCKKFDHLAKEFLGKSGDFGFLLEQRIEFAIIMIAYIFEDGWDFILEKNKIQVNFETLFQNRYESEIRFLVSACQKNLSDMILFKGDNLEKRRFARLKFKTQLLKNSIKRIENLSEKISRYFPNSLT